MIIGTVTNPSVNPDSQEFKLFEDAFFSDLKQEKTQDVALKVLRSSELSPEQADCLYIRSYSEFQRWSQGLIEKITQALASSPSSEAIGQMFMKRYPCRREEFRRAFNLPAELADPTTKKCRVGPIRNVGSPDQDTLVRQAWQTLENNPKSLVEIVRKIESESVRAELARASVLKEPNYTLRHLEEFNLSDKKLLKNIVLSLLARDFSELFFCRKYFSDIPVEISDPSDVQTTKFVLRLLFDEVPQNLEAALLKPEAPSVRKAAVQLLAMEIDTQRSQEFNSLKDIVLEVFRLKGFSTSALDLQNSQLAEKLLRITPDLVKMDKQLAQRLLESLPSMEGSEKKQKALEFIYAIARFKGAHLLARAEELGLGNLYALVLRAATENTRAVFENISCIDPENQELLVGIAELLAKVCPDDLCYWFSRFKIQDQEARLQIAKIVAKLSPNSLSQYFDWFPLESDSARAQILDAVLEGEARGNALIPKLGITKLADINRVSSWKNVKGCRFGIDYARWFPGFVLPEALRPEHCKPDDYKNLVNLYLTVQGVFDGDIADDSPFLKQVMRMRNLKARDAVMELLRTNMTAEQLKGLKRPIDVAKSVLHAKNIDIPIGRRAERDYYFEQQYLITVSQLIRDSAFDNDAVQKLLRVAATGGQSSRHKLKKLQVVTAMISMGELDKLKKVEDEEALLDALPIAFLDRFKNVSIDNLTQKFYDTIQQFRQPLALIVYYQNLQELGDQSVIGDIETLFREILEGDFLTNRYKSDHLQGLFSQMQGLEEAWCSGASIEECVSSQDKSKIHIVDTDDPCDMLLMGTEVDGSCLSVAGSPVNSKGLVGTILDGKNRMIALKDPETGVIKGRMTLRLMKERSKPALFLEKYYPKTLGKRQAEMLISFAKERATSLGLPLYTGLNLGEKVDVKLTSSGGRGAYQYVDATYQMQGAAFTISQPRLIQESTQQAGYGFTVPIVS
jgi:hypothetical protein